jgi:hypothetical protein
MPVESATYINQLVSANPAGADAVSDGATHLRLIKQVLQSTFPNITAPVTQTAVQLNTGVVPIGCIVMWIGTMTAVPAGWAACNGSTYTRTDGLGTIVAPYMFDRFPVCAGGSYGYGAVGGNANTYPSGSISGTALTADQHAPHSHGVNDPGHAHSISDPGHAHSYNTPSFQVVINGGAQSVVANTTAGATTSTNGTGIGIYAAGTGISIANQGSGNPHYHTFTGGAVDTRPPYYAISFIMKI